MTVRIAQISSSSDYLVCFMWVVFVHVDNLAGVLWYFIVVLIYISLLTNALERTSVQFLVICISSFVSPSSPLYIVIHFTSRVVHSSF